jgi:exosortase
MSGRMANDVSTASTEQAAGFDYLGFLKRRWTSWDFINLLLFLGIVGTLFYFFGIVHIYDGLSISTWAWYRFQPQYNFEHGKLVPIIFAYLVWYHREDLAKAKKEGCNQGLIWVVLGCIIFAAGARTLQGRVGMAAGPVLLYGIVLYLWGKEVARILLFPIVFLVFMIPVAAIEQATFRLQFLVTGAAKVVCGLVGIPLYAEGTTLRPLDQSFGGFDVAEGCSGIRSLMAMIMVTAIYVHLTQNKLWKKATILLLSTGFAIIGNAGRIVSIFIVAKFFGAAFAGGPYHEYSGYVSFPIALLAMLMLSKLLDMPIFEAAKAIKTGKAEPGSGLETLTKKDQATYDY